ncbi:MAG: hypothetical protein DMD96_31580 [Candidatus Rokuibacteriota bacterium]|nr:MAG: hypothetical protein DMD96_31580 [Candidatus Rokubacteria bacterium]
MKLRERWGRLGAWRLLIGLVLLVAVILVVSSPRSRAFVFGSATAPPDDRAGGARPTARLSAQAGASSSAASTDAGMAPGRRLTLPDAEGRIRIRVADRVPPRLPADGVPVGWTVKEFAGRASVELVRDGTHLALRLKSERSSFALYRDVVVDLNEFPFLSWSWKVVRLPADGDVRERASDDEAAQVYVIFPRWPSPVTTSDVIGYVWDSRAPVGTRLTSTKASNVKIIVVASGGSQRATWLFEERQVAHDYAALFGRQPPRVGQVAVMIDTNDTRGVAEALIGDLVFSRKRSENKEIPTSMLR